MQIVNYDSDVDLLSFSIGSPYRVQLVYNNYVRRFKPLTNNYDTIF